MSTIRDLAKMTGYSVTTISRVLNNDPTLNVTDHTRRTILEAADETHYSFPKHKHTNKSRPICVAVAEMMSEREKIWDPYYLYLKNYVVRSCMDQGWRIYYLTNQNGQYQNSVNETLDGILAIGIFSEEQISQMRKICSNIVFVDSSPDEQNFASVTLNFRQGVEQALEYLIKKGHERIGFLGPAYKMDQKKHPAKEVRREFFQTYMESLGKYDSDLVIDTTLTLEETRDRILKWLESGIPHPTAVLAYNEETAITAVNVFTSQGLRVPEDISVINFTDTPISAMLHPPLTSISADLKGMGDSAVKLLAERIQNPLQIPYRILLPLVLKERESVLANPGPVCSHPET